MNSYNKLLTIFGTPLPLLPTLVGLADLAFFRVDEVSVDGGQFHQFSIDLCVIGKRDVRVRHVKSPSKVVVVVIFASRLQIRLMVAQDISLLKVLDNGVIELPHDFFLDCVEGRVLRRQLHYRVMQSVPQSRPSVQTFVLS